MILNNIIVKITSKGENEAEQVKEITVIPSDPRCDLYIWIEQKQLNLVAYCRVSTELEQQGNSYEAQVK